MPSIHTRRLSRRCSEPLWSCPSRCVLQRWRDTTRANTSSVELAFWISSVYSIRNILSNNPSSWVTTCLTWTICVGPPFVWYHWNAGWRRSRCFSRQFREQSHGATTLLFCATRYGRQVSTCPHSASRVFWSGNIGREKQCFPRVWVVFEGTGLTPIMCQL